MNREISISPVVASRKSAEEKLFLGQRRPLSSIGRETRRWGCSRHGTALGGTRSPTQFAVGGVGKEEWERRFFERRAKVERDRRNFSWSCQAESPRRRATRGDTTRRSVHKRAPPVIGSGPTDRPPSPSTATSTPGRSNLL